MSKGLAVQIDLHVPHGAETEDKITNYHAHLLITTRRLEGDRLAAKKARDLDPQVRAIRGRPVVAEGELWGEVWRDHQNRYFGDHGLGITVDPIAAVPGEHLGPIRFRHPESEKVKAAEIRREVNAEAVRDPATVVNTLRRQQQFDDRTLDRFLAKHLTDPDERAAVKERVLKQESARPRCTTTILPGCTGRQWQKKKHGAGDPTREALERQSMADYVPSGWTKATPEDVARQISPAYAAASKRVDELDKEHQKAEWARKQREIDVKVAVYRQGERWEQMAGGLGWRQIAHKLGFKDREMAGWQRQEESVRRGLERAGVVEKLAADRLKTATDLAWTEYDKVKPAAEKELARRTAVAETARERLRVLDAGERAIDRNREEEQETEQQRYGQRRGARLSM